MASSLNLSRCFDFISCVICETIGTRGSLKLRDRKLPLRLDPERVYRGSRCVPDRKNEEFYRLEAWILCSGTVLRKVTARGSMTQTTRRRHNQAEAGITEEGREHPGVGRGGRETLRHRKEGVGTEIDEHARAEASWGSTFENAICKPVDAREPATTVFILDSFRPNRVTVSVPLPSNSDRFNRDFPIGELAIIGNRR